MNTSNTSEHIQWMLLNFRNVTRYTPEKQFTLSHYRSKLLYDLLPPSAIEANCSSVLR